MNFPVKHHFSPAFSLQPWTGSDGLLCEIRAASTRTRLASRRTFIGQRAYRQIKSSNSLG